MELIIGNDPCTVKQVSKIIQGVPGSESLLERWIDLARELDLDFAIPELKRIVLADANYGELLVQLLNKFGNKNGDGARLSVLISAMETCGYKNVADKLKASFDSGSFSETRISSFRPNSQENDTRRRKRHIRDNLKDLMQNTQVNDTIITGLYSKNYLSEEDYDALDALANKTEKTKLLYNIMSKRPQGYDAFIAILREACQDYPADILAKVYST